MQHPIPISVRAIAEASAAQAGISYRDLVSPCRRARIVRARHVAIYLASEMTPLRPSAIGRLLRRERTSVLYSRDKVSAALRHDDQLRADVDAIRSILSGGEAGHA